MISPLCKSCVYRRLRVKLTRRGSLLSVPGPAGLSAAYHLARKGYSVTVIEAAPQAGGMMRYSYSQRR